MNQDYMVPTQPSDEPYEGSRSLQRDFAKLTEYQDSLSVLARISLPGLSPDSQKRLSVIRHEAHDALVRLDKDLTDLSDLTHQNLRPYVKAYRAIVNGLNQQAINEFSGELGLIEQQGLVRSSTHATRIRKTLEKGHIRQYGTISIADAIARGPKLIGRTVLQGLTDIFGTGHDWHQKLT